MKQSRVISVLGKSQRALALFCFFGTIHREKSPVPERLLAKRSTGKKQRKKPRFRSPSQGSTASENKQRKRPAPEGAGPVCF